MNSPSKIIVKAQSNQLLSKEQKHFNKLNSQIANQKKELINWQNKISEFKIIYANEMLPIQKHYNKLRIKLAYLFDEVYDNKIFTKTERKKMLYIIEEIAQDLAYDDEKLKNIYNNRGNNDFDEEQVIMEKEELDYMKAAIFEEFDINLDDIDINNSEDFMHEFAKQIEEKIEQQETKKTSRKKSAKTIEREAKLLKQEQDISQSIKEVYRQLAKTIHPDRELDVVMRDQKTELMQKINTAYKNNDLLTLLQVQLEVEQIDQNLINSISIEKIKHYNIILKRQLQELQEEIYFISEKFSMEFNVFALNPEVIIVHLRRDIEEFKIKSEQLTNDLIMFIDNKQLKDFLKKIRMN